MSGAERETRAARLARLRGPAGSRAEDAPALAALVRALKVEAAWPEPARPGAPPAPSDLDRLPGAGPGLVAALRRAGVTSLADLAARAPGPLADALGPAGRLVDFDAWIRFAATEAEAG